MAESIRARGKVRLDLAQAVRRAFRHQGVVIGDQQSVQPKSSAKSTSKPPTELGEKRVLQKPPKDSASAKGPESLVELTEKSLDILFEATTVFPFTLFPDTITLDREKVTIANRSFWRVANITSTPISEIMTVESNVGPFFGSLHLTFRFFADNQRTINFLTRSDATKMQRLLHGYIIAHRREIDCTNVNLEDLRALLLELGQGASD